MDYRMTRLHVSILCALLITASTGCSVRQMAMNQLADTLASTGTAISSDDDPELIKAAVPFSLKLMEIVLEQTPEHQGLLYSTSSGFTQYAYAFVQLEADQIEDEDFAEATHMRERARKLYLRARDYGLRGLEVDYKDFETQLYNNPEKAIAQTDIGDVPLLYWTAVSWAGAIGVSKDDPELLAELPMVDALIDRALELDEDYENGAIHSFLIAYELSRQGGTGSPMKRARKHYQRAVELSHGMLAGPMVAYAEAISVQEQNLTEFRNLLNRALAIDVNQKPEWRLVNVIMQERARWLLSRTDELFLIAEPY